MKRAVPVLVAALLFGLSPVVFGSPDGSGKSTHKVPQKPAKKLKPEQPKPEPPTTKTHSGVMTSMRVLKTGEISEISLKISGSVANETVRGCGAKTADHPLLLWAFTEKRLVYLTVDPNNCFSNVLIGAPT